MNNKQLDTTVNELSAVFEQLFAIEDEHDVLTRPVVLSQSIALLDRTIQSLELLVSLAKDFDPTAVAKHEDDIKCFTEMKMKLLAEQNNQCQYWLSGTYH